ncbi:zinc-dependent alcohol dehydrogenase family protein [Myceligenerans cantabricum]
MRGVVMHAPGDVRVEDRPDAAILEPTDAVVRVTATSICSSDVGLYRGINELAAPTAMGHEYVGVVEQTGEYVRNIKAGDFVVGSFVASDNTCETCEAGHQSRCANRVMMGSHGTQAELVRVPLADGTLVPTPQAPSADLIPSLLAACDVLGSGWFGAVLAEAGPGKALAVVGDGALGLSTALAARHLGTERIIVFTEDPERQTRAREFGATDVVEMRGDAGVTRVKELTGGYGAHGAVDTLGTGESIWRAIRATRAGGCVAQVDVSHGTGPDGQDLNVRGVHLRGGPAPVRRFLPELVALIWNRKINPGKIFDLAYSLEDAPDAYRAMDERRATKVLLTP